MSSRKQVCFDDSMTDAPLNPNAIACGDCLDVLQQIAPGSARLIYLDPPFNTRKTRRGTGDSTDTYADHFGATGDYIAFLKPRLAVMQRALAPNGLLFFYGDFAGPDTTSRSFWTSFSRSMRAAAGSSSTKSSGATV